jgi:hypothetical protein
LKLVDAQILEVVKSGEELGPVPEVDDSVWIIVDSIVDDTNDGVVKSANVHCHRLQKAIFKLKKFSTSKNSLCAM